MKYSIPALLAILLFSCTGRQEQVAESTPGDFTGPPRSLYLQLVDGLHVTGEKIDVDIGEYLLQVTGDAGNRLSLSFQEIKEMKAETRFIELNCPGFFTDRGDWTGVPLKTILEKAQPLATVSEVEFISIDGGYSKKIPFEQAMEDRFLLAYEFDGKEFPPIHGYPVRLAAEGEEGNVWVKWLGEIRLISPM